MPDRCPSCGSPYIAGFGTGTQKIEELTRKMFPQARVLRMDMDTTSRKGGHEEILAAFGDGEADILIGTQMIVKGHDFPRVTLVGVLAADLSLHAPDFACGERTFQILTQAAGRAGRGEHAGRVVIQTYMPEHYSIQAAASQDYEMFYEEEMSYRRMLHYPPAVGMLTIAASSPKEEVLIQAARGMREAAERVGTENMGEDVGQESGVRTSAEIIGPVDAPVDKVNDIYRKILYIKREN